MSSNLIALTAIATVMGLAFASDGAGAANIRVSLPGVAPTAMIKVIGCGRFRHLDPVIKHCVRNKPQK